MSCEPPRLPANVAGRQHPGRDGRRPRPGFLGRSAWRRARAKPNERILVVVQLLGGNDGLNTVVPHGIDGYTAAAGPSGSPAVRSTRSPRRSACTPRWGRWPSSSRTGRLAVVQGVGYPNPDRSHFRSMEIWETAGCENDARRSRPAGWAAPSMRTAVKAGRRPAGLCTSAAAPLPLALRARKTEVPSLESLESYRLQLAGTGPESQADAAPL